MAEHQLPKLTVRVRFPSSALITNGQVGSRFRTLAVRRFMGQMGRRAISVPLGGHGHPGRATPADIRAFFRNPVLSWDGDYLGADAG